MGYVVNFTVGGSVCLISFFAKSPPWTTCTPQELSKEQRVALERQRQADEVAVQKAVHMAVEFASSQTLLEAVVNEVGELEVLKKQKDPKAWLGSRLKVDIVTDSDVLAIQLIRYPYVDRDNADEYRLVLESVLRVLESNVDDRVSLQTLQRP